jgi:hypothetical protein
MRARLTRVTITVSVLVLVVASYGSGSVHLLTQSDIAADDTCQTFAETGHTICGDFLAYWQSHGGIAQQGFPISDVFDEKSETDGKTYKVQYFERAVFEAHPENQPPYNVLLSLLGRQKYQTKYGGTPPTATTPSSSVPATLPNATSAIMLLSVTGGAVGGGASVSIKGPPSTTCVLIFTTPAGKLSKASGLGAQTTTSAGTTTWNWKLDSDTGQGIGKITVVCGNVSTSAPITVT